MVEFQVEKVSPNGVWTTETVEVAQSASHNRSMRQKSEPEFEVLREIGYMRVSADAQDVALQKDALVAAGCTLIFSDKWTGKDRHRPGLDAMVAQLQPGDRVNVWKVDRLGRNTVNGIEFVQDLMERKCAFRSMTQSFDTATGLGRMILGILLVFAEFERDTIVERVNAGLAAARERGIIGGTRRSMDGDTVARARAAYANRPMSPATGKPMTLHELAENFGVHYATFCRWADPHYFEGGTRDAQRFRDRHPDLAEWLERSNDPAYADSPRRARRPR